MEVTLCDESDFPCQKELLVKEGIRSLGSKFFPLREVSFFKRDAIEGNHCLFQLVPFDVRIFQRSGYAETM